LPSRHREEIRDNTERIAQENGIEIEFIRKIKAFRKEARIKEIIAKRLCADNSWPQIDMRGRILL